MHFVYAHQYSVVKEPGLTRSQKSGVRKQNEFCFRPLTYNLSSRNASAGETTFRVLPSDSGLLSPAFFMVGLGRLELPTSPLSGVRSNHLSYRPMAVNLVELVGIEPATS